ncbi:endonuclease domain-containing protein [uncultured Devosia sp.]|uniref:endonuclease domain-containing protein n=1 Tax=uncultured Devosia sp. TaxID=211434 RepID=UPI0035C9E0FA
MVLRSRRLANYKFRRQVPMGRYIADFLCFDPKLIVEVDGSQHSGDKRDMARDADLEQRGFRVLRVWNNDVLGNPASVSEAIWAAIQDIKP